MSAPSAVPSWVAAVHEAAHAVAACMRGVHVTVVAVGSGDAWGTGRTVGGRVNPWDARWIAWCGPAAEARARAAAEGRPADPDDLLEAMLEQPQDAAVVGEVDEVDVEVWASELDRVWPAVLTVAGRLTAGVPVDDRAVREAVDAALDAALVEYPAASPTAA